MLKPVRGLGRFILNNIYKTLFPLKCSSCNKEGSFLCRSCEKKLEYLSKPEQSGTLPVYIEQLISCFPYKDPINSLIILGKYSFMPEVFAYLGKLSAAHLRRQRYDLKSYVLCPIPLSKQRQRWRGFNQSQKLCETFSKELRLPWRNFLERPKNTKTQKDLSRAGRQKNMKNSFALNPNLAAAIKGQQIILVDDVATTGATLSAAAEVLAQASAAKIIALTIARD
jgi:ComF family protein